MGLMDTAASAISYNNVPDLLATLCPQKRDTCDGTSQ
jgi:hypothetical protein